MTRSQKRKTLILVLLCLLLMLLGAWYVNYRSTGRLSLNIEVGQSEALPAPEYLYSFNGRGKDLLVRPLGVLVDGQRVYVTDSRQRKAFIFTPKGALIKSFGEGKLAIPLYIAKNPKDGNLYISDRGTKTIMIFKPDGTFVRVFDPKMPKSKLPKFDTKGDQWIPVAIAFAPDGRMYVSDLLNGHRIVFFDKNGKFIKTVGDAGQVLKNTEEPEVFLFPNSIKVSGKQLLVADSNNRRVQVFDLDGKYKQIFPVGGLPRGLSLLGQRSNDDTKSAGRFVVVDTLAHDATIWSQDGKKLVTFGGSGVLEGQFSYPADVSVGSNNLIFITDSDNARVQVWGWPQELSPIPTVRVPANWGWCLTPLLLLPLLLFFRRKKFVASREFVYQMFAREEIYLMDQGRIRWLVLPEEYEELKELEQGDVSLADLLNPYDYSESDAAALRDKLEVDEQTSRILALAQRAKLFCTEDADLRRIARVLEIPVVNAEEFADRPRLKKHEENSSQT